MLSELQELARRLEQQVTSFEKLHTDEMKRFQEQFETLSRLQDDELAMLRKELKQLQDEVARLQTQESEPPRVVVPPDTFPARPAFKLTRRDLLTGHLRPDNRTGD